MNENIKYFMRLIYKFSQTARFLKKVKLKKGRNFKLKMKNVINSVSQKKIKK